MFTGTSRDIKSLGQGDGFTLHPIVTKFNDTADGISVLNYTMVLSVRFIELLSCVLYLVA